MFLVLLRSRERLVVAEAPEKACGLVKGSLAAFTEDGILEEVGIVSEVCFMDRDDVPLKIIRELHPEMALVTRVWVESWNDEEETEREC
jgi:hypothetical protein